jgi:hypothetical protein
MGAFVFDTATATAITKTQYTKKAIDMIVLKSPALGLMPKETVPGGLNYVGATGYAPPQSGSSVDTVAFTTGAPSQYAQWVCTWADFYQSCNISGKAWAQTQGTEGALVKIVTEEVDRGLENVGFQISTQLWGSGGGAVAQLASGTVAGTGPFGLSNAQQITNMQVGQILNASATNGTTGAVRAGSVQIASIDINAGTFTLTGNGTAGIAALTNTDFLFNQGGFGLAMQGIPAWLPTSANRPTAGNPFNAVDRAALDPTRLAGVYYLGNGATKRESLMQLAMLIQRMGGKPTHIFIHPLDYADVIKEMTGSVTFPVTEKAFGSPQIGFDGVRVVTPAGIMSMFIDPFVPSGSAWMLTLSDFLMPSMGEVPTIADEVDGLQWCRQFGSDTYQLRIVAHWTMYLKNPGHSGCVTF